MALNNNNDAKKERYEKVIAWFQQNVPVAET
jgi:hypothetical protein